jgi:hypothetical protein
MVSHPLYNLEIRGICHRPELLVTVCRRISEAKGCHPEEARAAPHLASGQLSCAAKGCHQPLEMLARKVQSEGSLQPTKVGSFSRCNFLSNVGLPRDNVWTPTLLNRVLK